LQPYHTKKNTAHISSFSQKTHFAFFQTSQEILIGPNLAFALPPKKQLPIAIAFKPTFYSSSKDNLFLHSFKTYSKKHQMT
jgi:hypothetical protein